LLFKYSKIIKEDKHETAVGFAFSNAEWKNSRTKTAPKEVGQKTAGKINTNKRGNSEET
jgi:hypothetical protein